MANGGTQCNIFNRHFKDWWESGALRPGGNQQSIQAFKKFAKMTNNFEDAWIECICAPSVSPAAAKMKYDEKRDFYEKYCYQPGLLDHTELNS